MCIEFADWFYKACNLNEITKEDHNTKFPVIWNRFLLETNNTDKIELNIKS